jgi:hypothetical protein
VTIPARDAPARNHPNPFIPATTISFGLPEAGRVRLEVFNVPGQVTATLIGDEPPDAGRHTATFDATGLPPGVYFYRIKAGEFSAIGKMVLPR